MSPGCACAGNGVNSFETGTWCSAHPCRRLPFRTTTRPNKRIGGSPSTASPIPTSTRSSGRASPPCQACPPQPRRLGLLRQACQSGYKSLAPILKIAPPFALPGGPSAPLAALSRRESNPSLPLRPPAARASQTSQAADEPLIGTGGSSPTSCQAATSSPAKRARIGLKLDTSPPIADRLLQLVQVFTLESPMRIPRCSSSSPMGEHVSLWHHRPVRSPADRQI